MHLNVSRPIHVVGDSSALIAFAAIRRLDLLAAVFAGVQLPPAVHHEIAAANLAPNRLLLDAMGLNTWLQPVGLSDEMKILARLYEASVDRGEAEAIALAKISGKSVLLDDLAARRLAVSVDVAVLGSLGILKLCKAEGVIARTRPIAEEMRRVGRFFSATLLNDFYQQIGEG